MSLPKVNGQSVNQALGLYGKENKRAGDMGTNEKYSHVTTMRWPNLPSEQRIAQTTKEIEDTKITAVFNSWSTHTEPQVLSS